LDLEAKAKLRTKEVETNPTLLDLEAKAKARTVDSYAVSNEQRRRHAREMLGPKDPTRRSSFS